MFSNIAKNIIKFLSDFLISLYKFAAFVENHKESTKKA